MPLASLQAAAGNRAVASAIRSGAGTAIQRATGTAQLPKAAGQERTTSTPADDLGITPVTEPERPGGETRQGEDATTEQQVAVDEVETQKKNVADASLARAAAAADVWQSSGEAVEARKKAAAARGEAERLTREAGEAEISRTGLLEKERGLRETAGTAAAEQQAAEGRAERHKAVEGQRRKAVDAALAEERKFTQKAKKAEEERAAAEARVAAFTKQAAEAREKQKAAEARVAALKKQAEEAEEKRKAAEAAAQRKAVAEDEALQKAAKAQAEAEADDKVAKSVEKWADEVADALKEAGLEAHRWAGEADGADTERTRAEKEQQEWAATRETAREQAAAARERAAVWGKEAETAAKEHTRARNEAAEHGKAAAAAQQQADTARDQAAGFAETARQKREAADSARVREQQQADIAAVAQRHAAAAAQTQLEQGTAETEATTALTARKTAKKAAGEAAEAARKKAAEAGKQTDESGPADAERADEAGGALREVPQRAAKAVGHATKKAAAQVKPWIDPADTAILRGSAPVGGALRADASRTGDTGRMDGAVIQQHVENPINTISDVAGTVNDVVALKDSAGKRGESGPASHAHRKNWRGKPLGLLTNALMSVNDGVKIAGNSLTAVKNTGPVAALGDAGGALTIAFSSVIAARDAKVIKDTRARREALKKHFQGVAAQRVDDLQGVLGDLGKATAELAQKTAGLAASQAGPEAEGHLQAIEDERVRIDSLRSQLLGHMASLRDYAVDKKKRKLAHRAANLGGNGARIAAGAVAIAAAAGAVSGPVGPAVAGGLTAAALGGYAVKKGAKKAGKRYTSVRQPDKYARTTPAQEGTEKPEAPTMSKDGKGGSKRAAWKEALTVTHSIKQGKRQLRAQEIYALAAGPAVPAGKHVPNDVREYMREFLKALKCGPDDHKQSNKAWEDSLNDPEQQTEWEEAIAKQLASV
ncbi:hypothetical protein ACIRFH_13900 [Streptomyces sp. NPDC093586]|uniref:hypothetical protein n=1 Tax=Streptomyces sp. NPDC093586 TaxID=3366042 RepID=UPI003817E405